MTRLRLRVKWPTTSTARVACGTLDSNGRLFLVHEDGHGSSKVVENVSADGLTRAVFEVRDSTIRCITRIARRQNGDFLLTGYAPGPDGWSWSLVLFAATGEILRVVPHLGVGISAMAPLVTGDTLIGISDEGIFHSYPNGNTFGTYVAHGLFRVDPNLSPQWHLSSEDCPEVAACLSISVYGESAFATFYPDRLAHISQTKVESWKVSDEFLDAVHVENDKIFGFSVEDGVIRQKIFGWDSENDIVEVAPTRLVDIPPRLARVLEDAHTSVFVMNGELHLITAHGWYSGEPRL